MNITVTTTAMTRSRADGNIVAIKMTLESAQTTTLLPFVTVYLPNQFPYAGYNGWLLAPV